MGSTRHPTSDLSWLRYLTLKCTVAAQKEKSESSLNSGETW